MSAGRAKPFFLPEHFDDPSAHLLLRPLNPAPVKIAHVVNSLDAGGMENGVVNLACRLPAHHFRTEVWCLEHPGVFAERLPPGVSVRVLGKRGGFTPAVVAGIRRQVMEHQPDVLHTHNLGPLIYTGLARMAGCRTRLLHGEHAELSSDERTFQALMQRRFFFRCADRVHTVSRTLVTDLHAAGLHHPHLMSIVNGVDIAKFSPGTGGSVRDSIGLPQKAFVLGMVGRFGPFKRHRLLLEAFDRLAGGFPGVHLLMVGGGGPEEASVRTRAGVSAHADRIHLAGLQADMPAWYRAMDVLVVPSVNEGLSNAVLEAMACGVPALAHAACGNGEVITHGVDGWLGRFEDAEGLARELRRILDQPALVAECSGRARRKVEAGFSLGKMVDQYAAVYESLARASVGAPPACSGP